MKKYIYLAIVSLGLLVMSCNGNDDQKTEIENPNPTPQDPNTPVTVASEWEPATIKINSLIPLPIPSIDYPHANGCTKDYLQIKTDNTAKFFRYAENSCEETVYNEAFVRSENNVTLNIMGYTISGVITTESSTTMKIESDIKQYEVLIETMFPQYATYLTALGGSKVELQLNKK